MKVFYAFFLHSFVEQFTWYVISSAKKQVNSIFEQFTWYVISSAKKQVNSTNGDGGMFRNIHSDTPATFLLLLVTVDCI